MKYETMRLSFSSHFSSFIVVVVFVVVVLFFVFLGGKGGTELESGI